MLPETRQYRRLNQELTRALVADWNRIWPGLDVAALDSSFPRWLVVAAGVVGGWRAAAAMLAAEYLKGFTEFPAVPVSSLEPQLFAISMRVTVVATVKRATGRGLGLADASALGFGVSVGAAQRLVLNAGRQVVAGTCHAAPDIRGWQRVGSGECKFCADLIAEGTVYSDAGADFPAHDACRCSAEPVTI